MWYLLFDLSSSLKREWRVKTGNWFGNNMWIGVSSCVFTIVIRVAAHSDSQPEWMELGGGGGAVSCAPSRLGKLVLRITGFPRITQRSQLNDTEIPQRDDAHYQESRHLYLGFQHPWDRDLWLCWIKQVG